MKSVFENMVIRKKRTAPEATETSSTNSEKSVHQMSSSEYESALRSNRSLRQQIDGSSTVRHIDLSKPANGERYAVVRPCVVCGRDTAVANDFKGYVTCSDTCAREFSSADQRNRNVLVRFAEETPSFYRCEFNTQQLVGHFQSHGLEWTVASLKAAFAQLSAEGKILPHISLKDIQKMSPDEYNTRLRLDPDLGGHKKEIDESARPVESAKPGFEPGSRLATLQRAAENARKAQSANYANRYSGAESYVNGARVEAPGNLEQSVVFRNGRRVS